MKRFLPILFTVVMMALPALGAWRNHRQVIMAQTEVATGTPVTVTIDNPDHFAGLVLVKTENETATASLVVTIYNTSDLGDTLVCTMTAITTNTTSNVVIGAGQVFLLTGAVEEGVSQACQMAPGRRVKFVFTVSGAGADFDVTADVEWLSLGP